MHKKIQQLYSLLFVFIFFSCSKADNNAASNDIGKGGSLARFTIVGNFLYTVDDYGLHTYNITNAGAPVKTGETFVGNSIETIYPFKNRLFIGSRNGMFIYSIDNPSLPVKLGEALHLRSCDPVVADDSIAYVTLKGNAPCGTAVSGLYVYDVTNEALPLLKKTIEMENPEGLGMKDTTLYVCNNANGLKVFNIRSHHNPVEIKTINDGNDYKDVIPYDNLLICYVASGIILYDISNPINPSLIKSISN